MSSRSRMPSALAQKREVLANNSKLVVGALLILVLLAVDSINPVKIIARRLETDSSYLGIIFFITLLVVIYYNVSDGIYFCIRIFFHSILSIFFKSIDIVGLENVPLDGPVIFTGNHANQFVDGVMVMMNCDRKVGFLVAEKSWKKPIIGFLCQAVGCIPVIRPQDAVIAGTGTIKSCDKEGESSFIVKGFGTRFESQVSPGDQIRIQGETVSASGVPVKVLSVKNDTELSVADELRPGARPSNNNIMKFGILKKVNQSEMFTEVYAHLKKGNCIGIFPEGGSHDRTDLLPLKAGVALMAFGVKDAHGITVPVVPVGLNYFRGHRFRGRVVIEFGSPVTVTRELLGAYKNDKRRACDEFLNTVEQGMRSVIVTAPDYNTLQLIFAARRLYQPSGMKLSPEKTQDLNRRFAEGYKVLQNKLYDDGNHHNSTTTSLDPSEDLKELTEHISSYVTKLKQMGLKDHQVPFIQWWGYHDAFSSALYGLLIFALASFPTFVLNAPVGLLARHFAKVEQKKALAGSKVKIAGRDVMLSKKILFSIVAVPTLWVSYLVLAVVFTDWYWSSILMAFFSCPLFSYFGVLAVEAGLIEFNSVYPLFYRFMPKYRAIQDALPAERSKLQVEVRRFVEKYSPLLGELANEKPMDWSAYMKHRSISDEDLASLEEKKKNQ